MPNSSMLFVWTLSCLLWQSVSVHAQQPIEPSADVQSLIAELQDWNSVRGCPAVDALANIGTSAVAPLLVALKDEKNNVRSGAAEALGKIGDKRAVEPLLAALKDKDSYVRQHASEALGRIGAPAFDQLLAALNDGDERVRSGVATALGQVADRRAVEPLITALQDESRYVRGAAIRSLAAIGDKRAAGPLFDSLKHEGNFPGMLRCAAEALEKMDCVPTDGEDYAWYLIARGRVLDCVPLGDSAVEPLIAVMENKNIGIARVPSALAKIGGNRAVEAMIAAVQDEGIRDRYAIAEALGDVGDQRAVEPLIGLASVEGYKFAGIASKSLQKLEWTPRTREERIHFLIGLHDQAIIDAKNWPDVKAVLMQDANSGDPLRFSYALSEFTTIGNESILPELCRLIRTKATKEIAQAYLNCNQEQLRQAARDWATRNGYKVGTTRGHIRTQSWGGW